MKVLGLLLMAVLFLGFGVNHTAVAADGDSQFAEEIAQADGESSEDFDSDAAVTPTPEETYNGDSEDDAGGY